MVGFGSILFGVAWLGYKFDWPRYLAGPNPDWISGQRFQGEINYGWRHATYPALIEMRCADGNAQYRSDWKPIPAGARYQAWSGMAPEDFARRDRDYGRSGYVLENSSRFRNCAGRERISATWLTRPVAAGAMIAHPQEGE